jgi:hypothetical protein
MPTGGFEQLFETARANGANGSTVGVSWPCGGILTPSPNATDGAFRATRREAWVTGFDCGAGVLLDGRCATGPVASFPISLDARVLALFLARGLHRGIGRREDYDAYRTRSCGELARDGGSRRVRLAIDAERRLTARSAREGGTTPDRAGPSDPRYAYLTQTHDLQGLAQLACDQPASTPAPEMAPRTVAIAVR